MQNPIESVDDIKDFSKKRNKPPIKIKNEKVYTTSSPPQPPEESISKIKLDFQKYTEQHLNLGKRGNSYGKNPQGSANTITNIGFQGKQNQQGHAHNNSYSSTTQNQNNVQLVPKAHNLTYTRGGSSQLARSKNIISGIEGAPVPYNEVYNALKKQSPDDSFFSNSNLTRMKTPIEKNKPLNIPTGPHANKNQIDIGTKSGGGVVQKKSGSQQNKRNNNSSIEKSSKQGQPELGINGINGIVGIKGIMNVAGPGNKSTTRSNQSGSKNGPKTPHQNNGQGGLLEIKGLKFNTEDLRSEQEPRSSAINFKKSGYSNKYAEGDEPKADPNAAMPWRAKNTNQEKDHHNPQSDQTKKIAVDDDIKKGKEKDKEEQSNIDKITPWGVRDSIDLEESDPFNS